MTKEQAIEAAFDAGTRAAAEKAYSTFNISNEASWTTYTSRIRAAMNAALSGHDGLQAATDTAAAQLAAIAQEDGFEIGVIDGASGKYHKRLVKFEDVDLILGTSGANTND